MRTLTSRSLTAHFAVTSRGAVPSGRALAAVALMGTSIATAAEDGVVLCPVRRCTGGYCPGCGGTRAARRLINGDLAGAWTQHPWVVLLAIQAVLVGGLLLAAPARFGALGRGRGALALTLANVAALICVWLVRLETGAIPRGWL